MTGDQAANQAMDRANMARFACRSHDHVQALPTLLPPMGGPSMRSSDSLTDGLPDGGTATSRRQRSQECALLPKHISGELRVNDAERIIEVNA